MEKISILFVCLGNICRSPMAEFVMKKIVSDKGAGDRFYISSAATSAEEQGNGVHYGTRSKLAEEGIPFTPRYAVALKKSDYERYEAAIGGEANADAVAKFNTALLNAPSNQHNVTVSGNSVSGYVIVKPESCSSLWSEQVTRLARTIKKYTGYDIPIVTDTEVEGGKMGGNFTAAFLYFRSGKVHVRQLYICFISHRFLKLNNTFC